MQNYLEPIKALVKRKVNKRVASVDSHSKTALLARYFWLYEKGRKHNSRALAIRFLFGVKRLEENAIKKRVSKENYAYSVKTSIPFSQSSFCYLFYP